MPKRDADVWAPAGCYGAVAPVDGRTGTEAMPGVSAQIGTEYGHKYGGTSFELFARISGKNHAHSMLNPLAAYQNRYTLEQIINDVMIAYPNTRPMCAANCDGAAAAIVCNGGTLKSLFLQRAGWSPRATPSQPPGSPTPGRSVTTCAARPATGRSKTPG